MKIVKEKTFHTKRIAIIMFLFMISATLYCYASTPPEQPESGPGGKEYYHASVIKHDYGKGAGRYWIFEPADPMPQSAPLVVFNHGWGAINPKVYGAWIEHIVRRGNIVIYPLYQDSLRTPVSDFLQNTVSAVKDALSILQENGHVHPQLDRCAVVGHSMGGVISADLAAIAQEEGLPRFEAVMCVEPGKTWAKGKRIAYRLHDLSIIPPETLLLTIVGDTDTLVKDIDAKRIFKESTRIHRENKNYIIIVSDNHDTPALEATHFAPIAPSDKFDSGEHADSGQGSSEEKGIRERIKESIRQRLKEREESQEIQARIEEGSNGIDALDYYGYWKLFDALCDAAFYGKNREYALGNTNNQRYMGIWSDGVPVKELVVLQSQ